MARRRYGRRRGRHGFKIPIISVGILAGQFLLAQKTDARPLYTLAHMTKFYTGFDPFTGKFYGDLLLIGYGPWIAKGLITRIARPMGAAPKVPFGLPISIS